MFNGLLVLWGVATLVFILFSALPADPARMMLGQRDDAETLEKIRTRYGFNLSLPQQYWLFMKDLSPVSRHDIAANKVGGFEEGKYKGVILSKSEASVWMLKFPFLRYSFQREGKQVLSVIKETLPNTVILACAAMFFAFIIGVSLGLVSAYYHNAVIDRLVSVISIIGMSVPSFFAAIFIAWLFAFVLREITGLPMTGSLVEIDDVTGKEVYAWRNLILPALTLGIRPLAVIVQLTRNSMLEVLSSDYIRTAKAKGLKLMKVWLKHALRNAMAPVITASSSWFASMLAGAVFVEFIFGWNGMGKEIVNALNNLDLPLVTGTVMVAASLFVAINIIVDISYALLDPRIRLS